jgi:hypothetical protein
MVVVYGPRDLDDSMKEGVTQMDRRIVSGPGRLVSHYLPPFPQT